MATVNYSWNLPTVGGDEDAWGGQLNANWTALDTLLGGVSQTEFAILDGATVTTAELNILDGATVTTAELNQLDGNIFTADLLPNADSTLDLGSSSAAWAIAYLDAIEPVGTNTTIKRVGGTNSTPIVEGIAKAWVNFNGTGTIAVRDSLNVSSLVDNGTGDYTVNFSNAFGAADYVPLTTNQQDTAGTVGSVDTQIRRVSGAISSGLVRVSCTTAAGSASDCLAVLTTCCGDLA